MSVQAAAVDRAAEASIGRLLRLRVPSATLIIPAVSVASLFKLFWNLDRREPVSIGDRGCEFACVVFGRRPLVVASEFEQCEDDQEIILWMAHPARLPRVGT